MCDGRCSIVRGELRVTVSTVTVTRTQALKVVTRTRTITRTGASAGALKCAEEEAATIAAMQQFMLSNTITIGDGSQNYAKVPDNADGFSQPYQGDCTAYDAQLSQAEAPYSG